MNLPHILISLFHSKGQHTQLLLYLEPRLKAEKQTLQKDSCLKSLVLARITFFFLSFFLLSIKHLPCFLSL